MTRNAGQDGWFSHVILSGITPSDDECKTLFASVARRFPQCLSAVAAAVHGCKGSH